MTEICNKIFRYSQEIALVQTPVYQFVSSRLYSKRKFQDNFYLFQVVLWQNSTSRCRKKAAFWMQWLWYIFGTRFRDICRKLFAFSPRRWRRKALSHKTARWWWFLHYKSFTLFKPSWIGGTLFKRSRWPLLHFGEAVSSDRETRDRWAFS